MSKKYMKGAEDFKELVLEASSAIIRPHIEGVFSVFERRYEDSSRESDCASDDKE